MGKEEKRTYIFDSPTDARAAFALLTGQVVNLRTTYPENANFQTSAGTKINAYATGTKIEVTLALGPGITTPTKIVSSIMSSIDACLSGLAN